MRYARTHMRALLSRDLRRWSEEALRDFLSFCPHLPVSILHILFCFHFSFSYCISNWFCAIFVSPCFCFTHFILLTLLFLYFQIDFIWKLRSWCHKQSSLAIRYTLKGNSFRLLKLSRDLKQAIRVALIRNTKFFMTPALVCFHFRTSWFLYTYYPPCYDASVLHISFLSVSVSVSLGFDLQPQA